MFLRSQCRLASHYSIGNLEALAADMHKFESRYLDRLVGEYPKELGVYQARSPVQSVGAFSCPLIQFQGLEDKVVPLNQATEVYQALKEKGVPTACILFEGEQNGFRREGIICWELETRFYNKKNKSVYFVLLCIIFVFCYFIFHNRLWGNL